MADSPAPYRKLPGRGSGLIGASAVWEGDTHLLIVKSWPSGESYRRFFYADIQAIILRQTKRRMVINIVLGVIFVVAEALLVAAMFESVGESGVLVAGGVLGGICVFFVLVNSLLGPTCTMHIQTAIQCEPLPTVRRQRRARQILTRIQPRIAAAQAVAETAPV